jgi:S-adenosylmethionine:tRNA ribosyltransferase-isomerase
MPSRRAKPHFEARTPDCTPLRGSTDPVRTDQFDFELPDDRIALAPVSPRDAARLLVVEPGTAPASADPPRLADHIVRDLPALLAPGDLLVLNDTRVIPTGLEGERQRPPAGVRVACSLVERLDETRWRAFAKPGRRLQLGDRVRFGSTAGGACELGTLEALVEAKEPDGLFTLAFDRHGAYLDEAISLVGHMPLPPYIANRRGIGARDAADYQTVYARVPGAVAAPTAGLHFTPELFAALASRGIEHAFLTLHVGLGTFVPVKAERTEDHVMHAEWGEIGTATAERIAAARSRGGRIVAVGTTVLRLLESAAREDGSVPTWRGRTDIFITPGYRFRVVDRLLTNFHLPRSTLFMLVAAFTGLDAMQQAYAHAIRSGYRFYSYGDATLLSRAPARAQPTDTAGFKA